MGNLLTRFHQKQHDQLEAQQRHVKRISEAREEALKHVLESSLEKFASKLDDPLDVIKGECPSVVGFNVVSSDEFKASVDLKEADFPVQRFDTQADRQQRKKKLNSDFRRKEAVLTSTDMKQSIVARYVDAMEEGHERFANSASKRRWHFDRLKELVDGQSFSGFMVAVILLNAVFIGFTTDVKLKAAFENRDFSTWDRLPGGDLSWVLGAELLFTITFVLEITLRALALEGEFFFGAEAFWNVFDLLITISSVAEMILASSRVDLSFLRVLRITRVVRSVRVFGFLRLVPVMRSLRFMMLAIVKSIVPFVFAVTILLEVIFVFSVVIADGVAEYVLVAGDDISGDLRTYLGSMSRTILSLFMSMSGGVDWWTLADILLDIATGYLCLFVFFILFTVLAVLNIITGIFVQEAQHMASKDRDVLKQQEFDENRQLMTSLKQIFHVMDENNTGCVSLGEFEEMMKHEDVRLRLADVCLDFQDASTVFKLLDLDESNELSIEEFVMGCMRLKGRAHCLDVEVEVTLKDTKKLMRKVLRMSDRFSERLGNIERAVVNADEQ